MTPSEKQKHLSYIKRSYGVFLTLAKDSSDSFIINEAANKLILALAEYQKDLRSFGA